jgi:hypothetical protein
LLIQFLRELNKLLQTNDSLQTPFTTNLSS